MLHRVVIINDLPIAPEPRLDLLLPAAAGYLHRHLSWDARATAEIGVFGAHLVIALAAAERARSMAMLRSLRDGSPGLPLLAVLSGDSDDELLRTAAATADDFIFIPLRPDELRSRVARLLGSALSEAESARLKLTRELGLAQLVGEAPAFVEVINQIPPLAASDAPVLMLGETGTGKELCARAIHHLSARANLPFIPVDCGALPEHLAENELFGHARGAFTGAHAEQKGLAGMADGGTLFLDEIDSLPLAVQAKLLRFLEDRTYRALGADRFTHSNVRVLAASNRDLEAGVRARQFRGDLYFRLNVLQLRLPPLRHRGGDVALLARHFLETLRRPDGASARSFSPSALRLLEQYPWPGNVRELYNVVQRAVVLRAGPQILPAHLGLGARPDAAAAGPTFREGRARAVAEFERCYVEGMLREHEGNITRAARAAQKDRRAFGRLVKKYAFDRSALQRGD